MRRGGASSAILAGLGVRRFSFVLGRGWRWWAGSALMILGVTLLLATIGMFAQGEFERVQVERDLTRQEQFDGATATAAVILEVVERAAFEGQATATAEARARETPTPIVSPMPITVAVIGPGAAPSAATAVPTETPPPMPPPRPTTVIPRRILAPNIRLDAPIIESKIVNGEWQVPKFVAGHLEGTALPNSGGNVVLSGHVQSISSGNVFANIERLAMGDLVTLRTSGGDVQYRVSGRNIVSSDDLSVVQSSGREELTLITCIGTFNPLTRDYSQRLVVWGDRVA